MITSLAKRRTQKARRGITIIELMVVCGGVAMLLAICAVTIQLLMRLNQSGQDGLRAMAAHDRLARQLRQDVRASESYQLANPIKSQDRAAGLRLKIESGDAVTYDVQPGSIVRNELRGDKIVSHESYSLPEDRVAGFAEHDEGSRKSVALVVSSVRGKSGTDPPRPLEILALPGKHRTARARQAEGAP